MFGHVKVDSGNEASRKEVVDVTQDSEDNESFNPCENQCHLCRKKLESQDDLWDHVEKKHQEYYNGMLEVAANQSKTNYSGH